MNTKILIVEDEALIAYDLKTLLEQAGFTVVDVVDNADDAVRAAGRYEPNLVMMDIRLRGPKDGVEAAGEIRRLYQTPVIFVTAHADRETLDRAKVTEPFGYIVKPFHYVNFKAQIEIVLWKHKMEQRLRVSEQWFSATCHSIADALIATDGDGKVAFMNPPAATLTGWDPEEAKGQPLFDVFRVTEMSTGLPFAPPLHEIMEGPANGKSAPALKLAKHNGTESVFVEAEMTANRDRGALFGIALVFRDVTARQIAERQERQLQKMSALSLMATGLGRELADSRSKMDTSLKHLIEESRGNTRRLLWDVYDLSAHQESVIQQLIALGKSDAYQTSLVDLHEVLAGMEEKIRKTLGTRRTLHVDLQPGITIRSNPSNLRENLLRLVSDARQATPEGGVVKISTTLRSAHDGAPTAQLKISDTRKILRADPGERVFDPYYQSGPGHKNSGFALSLVYRFVALSGGSIEVESAPGQGSTYLLNFPAVTTPQMEESSMSVHEPSVHEPAIHAQA